MAKREKTTLTIRRLRWRTVNKTTVSTNGYFVITYSDGYEACARRELSGLGESWIGLGHHSRFMDAKAACRKYWAEQITRRFVQTAR